MRSFIAFFKKELLEALRGGRFLILFIIFCVVGIMNPAITKLTPFIMEILSEELAESGMIITAITADALMSWSEFFQNVPMALMAFVFLTAGSFPKEYDSETLVIILTKGLDRYKVVLSKVTVMLLTWSIGYWICFLITYGCNAYFWDNSIAVGLIPASINWWVFGIFVVALMLFFSVISRGYGMVLLGTGGSILVLYLLGLLPRIKEYMPTTLMNYASLLIGAESFSDYLPVFIITAALSIALIGISIPIFNKKQI